jgi:hypothetical protein
MWLTWLFTVASLTTRRSAISALDRPAAMNVRDLAVLAAWALGGLLVSVRFFRWDPHRPRHSRAAGATNHDRSG